MNKEQALKQIEELKLFIQSIESKENLNDERDKWFLSILKDLKIGEIRVNYILYRNSKNEYIFQDIRHDTIIISYHIIWKILETKYKMGDDDIQEYIKDMLFKHLNWKVSTPKHRWPAW